MCDLGENRAFQNHDNDWKKERRVEGDVKEIKRQEM